MIEAEGLTKFFGDLEAVSDLSFAVANGEILGLVGPNGAGKTTCLYMLSGVVAPTRGIVRIGGHSLIDDPIQAKRLLGLVPDEPMLFDYMTVAEHFQFLGRIYQLKGVRERTRRLLDEFELADHENDLPTELSRGFRQRMAICCAFLHEPEAVFLDEPLTGLDPGAIRRVKDAVHKRARAGKSVIISSHLLSLVEELCDRVLIISHGKEVVCGSCEEIAQSVPALRSESSLEDLFLEITESNTKTADGLRDE